MYCKSFSPPVRKGRVKFTFSFFLCFFIGSFNYSLNLYRFLLNYKFILFKILKFTYYPVYWQTHYIVEVSIDSFNSHHSYPLLNSIGSSFVVWLVIVNIKFNLLLAKRMKFHVG